jgi:hypothetical protein
MLFCRDAVTPRSRPTNRMFLKFTPVKWRARSGFPDSQVGRAQDVPDIRWIQLPCGWDRDNVIS